MAATGPRFLPPAPTRRSLLRGGAAFVTTASTMTASASGAAARERAARSAAADFPGAEWAPADGSNYTRARRPSEYPVDYVVIHVAQQTYRDTVNIFRRASSDVSAHYVVASDGRVAQCVAEADIGWHAGNWDYNTRSVGIEHEGWVDEPEWFTGTMYRRSAELTAHLCVRHGIPRTREHIIGHHEVPGATHTDPGPLWDWERYLSLVNAA